MSEFVVKDSGKREEYDTGMVRDTQDGKPRFSLMRPVGVPYEVQFMTRCADHMTKGAGKYGERNWEKAHTQKELDRFLDSAERHMEQYLAGATDEDHAAAVWFNLNAAETVRWKMKQEQAEPEPEGNPFQLTTTGGWQIGIAQGVPNIQLNERVPLVPLGVDYHSHTADNPTHLGTTTIEHQQMAPHRHRGEAVMAHDPERDINPHNHTRE